MNQNEVVDILNNIFGCDAYEFEYSDDDDLCAYVFQNIEMEELIELSKQITNIDKSNTFKIQYIPEFTGFTIIFFKWLK